MSKQFQFGLVVRGQAEDGEDIRRRFQETLAFVRLADRLGYDSITKTAHYSAHPFQMLQLVPMLARFAAEAPNMRLNAGVLLLPLISPLQNHPRRRTGLSRRGIQGVRRAEITAREAVRGQSDRHQAPVDRGNGDDENTVF